VHERPGKGIRGAEIIPVVFVLTLIDV